MRANCWNKMLRCWSVLLLAVFLLCHSSALAQEEAQTVRIIELHGEINAAQRRYFESELREADKTGSALLLDIDTEEGLITEAVQIKESLLAAQGLVSAYISGKAVSAGMLIALGCEKIYMAPDAVIGEAEPGAYDYGYGGAAEAWEQEIRQTARLTGRDQTLFAAMADRTEAIEGVVTEEEILSLTGTEALAVGGADGVAQSAEEAAGLIWPNLPAQRITPTFGVHLSRFLNSTAVSALLFTAALLFLAIQLMMPPFGLFGVLSACCFALYFGGSFLAGYSQWWAIVLLAVGVGLLLVEMVIPGFGVLGISGILCVALSVFFASRSVRQFLISLAVAMGCCAVGVPLISRLTMRSKSFQKLVLEESVVDENREKVPSRAGREGVALTVLRPAGKAMVDGEKLDVQCARGYVPAGTAVRIVYEDGSKILVEPLDSARKTDGNAEC